MWKRWQQMMKRTIIMLKCINRFLVILIMDIQNVFVGVPVVPFVVNV